MNFIEFGGICLGCFGRNFTISHLSEHSSHLGNKMNRKVPGSLVSLFISLKQYSPLKERPFFFSGKKKKLINFF